MDAKIFLLFGLLVAIHGTFAVQKYAVKGRLLCGTTPASGVKVKLVDKDSGPRIDDKMDEKKTDGQGNFQLAGHASELIGNIDPMLKIYHSCNDGMFSIRKRRWRFELPKKYITSGANSNPKVVDVGTLNLELKPLEEDRNF